MDRSATPAPLRLSHVRLSYDGTTNALADLSLTVEQGEWLCVLGANGSGKSTLAGVLSGLLAPDEGEVELAGRTVFSAEKGVDSAAYREARRSLGLVFQNPDDQIVTTVVADDVAFGPENLGVPAAEIGRRVERELHRVALDDYAQADPTRLSGGQKQRVAIAGALAMEPSVLVLDEPGALLDVRGRTGVMHVIAQLHAMGTTVVHVTHFMDEALAASRVVVLDHGRVALDGTPDQVFSHTDKIVGLGLDEPFCARLATALSNRGIGVGWTCDEDDLARQVASLVATPQVEPVTVMPPQEVAAATGTPALELSHVSYGYDGRSLALDDVTFAVPRGSRVAVVGQTGSGKSTLARLVCALAAPDAGSVRVLGLDVSSKGDRRALRGRVGYVMQRPERQLFADTVLADVSYGPHNLGLSAKDAQSHALAALDLVGLDHGIASSSPFDLSGGQRRLVALAGVLAMDPELLVLDEPMAGLDPRGRDNLARVLDQLHDKGVTLIQVTHAMDAAAEADEVVVLDRARLLMHGTPREVFARGPELAASGLGVPPALAFAQRVGLASPNGAGEDGSAASGEPLTLDGLVDLISREAGVVAWH